MKGETIGGQGTSGGQVGTHLHFSISQQWLSEQCITNTYDPSNYIGARLTTITTLSPSGSLFSALAGVAAASAMH